MAFSISYHSSQGKGDPIILQVIPREGIRFSAGFSFPLEIEVLETGWWANPYIMGHHPAEGPPEAWRIFRAEAVSFPVEIWEERKQPPEARAIFCGCPDRFGAPTNPCGEASVRLEETTYWIELPKGCIDLEIITEEYAPVNIDGIPIGEENGSQPGQYTILLLRGGSIRGTIISATDGLPIAAASVLAKPLFVTRETLSTAASAEEAIVVRYGGPDSSDLFRTASNVRGRFRLAGLEPGNYRLSFLKRGLAPLTLDSVEVLADNEVGLDFVEMGPGTTVTAMISPAACGSEPLEVGLLRKMNATSAMKEKVLSTSPDGTVVFSNIAEGDYFLEIHGRCGAVEPHPMGGDAFTVNYGDDLFVSVDLDVCKVSGRISRDGDAVAGRVQCRKWGHNSGVEIATDDRGDFDVFLPGPGNFDFTVTTDDFRMSVSVRDIKCSDSVEIELPTSSISGTVNDENGNPVEGAAVEAERHMDQEEGLRRALRSSTISGLDGRFRIEGPEPGTWDLFATAEGRESGVVPAIIQNNDDSLENISLVIRDLHTIEFLSTDDNGGAPLPGVRLTVNWTRSGGNPLAGGDRASLVTDSQGKVELKIPKTAPSLRVVTTSSGRPVTWDRFPNQETITCRVPSGPGGFVVLIRSEGQWLDAGLPVTLIRHGGSIVNPIELALQFGYGAIDEEHNLTIGPLATGTYEIIYVTSMEEAGRLVAQPASCPGDVHISVRAGETITVNTPF